MDDLENTFLIYNKTDIEAFNKLITECKPRILPLPPEPPASLEFIQLDAKEREELELLRAAYIDMYSPENEDCISVRNVEAFYKDNPLEE